MVIANLMASVVALAMVGASTASVSKVENYSVGFDVVLNADVHKSYYDPDGDYATTSEILFNYSSKDMFFGSSVPTSSNYGGVINHSGSYNYIGFVVDSGLVSCDESGRNKFNLGVYSYDESTDGEVVTIDEGYIVDIYVDGVFALTSVYLEGGYFQIPSDGVNANSYIWVFDHASEADPYTPVDMLGDIAEGLTGGIVPVAEGIGSGLQSLVQDIFLNASHDGLSVFGIVTICFCGLALALGLSRWVLNFVDSLGSRDR